VDLIVSKKGKQVTGKSNEGELVAPTYEASVSKDDFIINMVKFKLLPDDYQIMARLRDPTSNELLPPFRTELKLRDCRRGLPELSGLEFVREAKAAYDDSQFVRAGLRLIPSVARIYGDYEPEVIVYYEIYNRPDFGGEYMISYSLRSTEEELLADTTLIPSEGARTPRLERVDVGDLLPGEYKIALTVQSPGSDFKLKREADFKIGWSAVGLVKNDYETAVEQLRYIATGDQLKQLKRAREEERLQRWNEFWKSQDPTPATPENELRDEYYKRLRYSDLNFGHFGRDGWKTDMGKVYITYGQPDEIERHPFDIDAKPYQIWTYYDPWRIFRFVDINGYGEYELIPPYDGDPRKIR
jgi:GWxTD domain-containing protein